MNVQSRKLRRSRTDRVAAGVCGGLGEFFGISPLWFRLFFLFTLLPGGISGLLYFLAWLVIPAE